MGLAFACGIFHSLFSRISPFFEAISPLTYPFFIGAFYFAASAGNKGNSPLDEQLLKVFTPPYVIHLLLIGIVEVTLTLPFYLVEKAMLE